MAGRGRAGAGPVTEPIPQGRPLPAEKKARELNGLYNLLPQSYPEAFEPGWLEDLEMLETMGFSFLATSSSQVV